MVNPRNADPFIDGPRKNPAAAGGVLKANRAAAQSSSFTGRVVEVLEAGAKARVEYPIDDPSTEGVGSTDGGYTFVGAIVQVLIGADGKISQIVTPSDLPDDADLIPTGATSKWLDAEASRLDAANGATRKALDEAQTELTESQAELVTHLATLGIDVDTTVITEELWAKLASFAKVTTDMLIAGNATITNELLVDTLSGKTLVGGAVIGGELVMEGSKSTAGLITLHTEGFESGTPARVRYSDYAFGLNSWSISSYKSYENGGIVNSAIRDTSIKHSGASSFRFEGQVWRDSSADTTYIGAISPLSTITDLAPFAGEKVVEAWIRVDNSRTKIQPSFTIVNANGARTLTRGDFVTLAANTWTKMTFTIPSGYRWGGEGFAIYSTVADDPSYPSPFHIWLDDIKVTTTEMPSAKIRLYRDDAGEPNLDVYAAGVLRARLSATSSGDAGMTFYSSTGQYILSNRGISTGSQTVPWADVISSSNYVDLSSQCTLGTDANHKMTRINLYKIGKLYILSGQMSGTGVSMQNWQLIDIGTIPESAKPMVNGASNPCSAFPSKFRQLIQQGSNKIQFQCLEAGVAPGSWDVQLMWVNP